MESGEIPFYLKDEVRVLDCKFKNVTLYNTDNMGKLFVTLFAFTPAPKTNPQWELNPDTLICTQLKSQIP